MKGAQLSNCLIANCMVNLSGFTIARHRLQNRSYRVVIWYIEPASIKIGSRECYIVAEWDYVDKRRNNNASKDTQNKV